MKKSRKTKLDVRTAYKALSQAIAESMSAEQIWRYLISPKTHETYRTQLDIYIPFFNTVRQTTFITTVLGVAKFSDSQHNALNAKRLFELLLEIGVNPDEIAKLDEEYNREAKTWEKIRKIRHNVFAHISASITEDQAFTLADITPNEISSCIKTAYDILVKIGNLIEEPSPELTFDPMRSSRDVSKLFRNLEAGREARLKSTLSHIGIT